MIDLLKKFLDHKTPPYQGNWPKWVDEEMCKFQCRYCEKGATGNHEYIKHKDDCPVKEAQEIIDALAKPGKIDPFGSGSKEHISPLP